MSRIEMCSRGVIKNLEVSVKGAVIRSHFGKRIAIGSVCTWTFGISVAQCFESWKTGTLVIVSIIQWFEGWNAGAYHDEKELYPTKVSGTGRHLSVEVLTRSNSKH